VEVLLRRGSKLVAYSTERQREESPMVVAKFAHSIEMEQDYDADPQSPAYPRGLPSAWVNSPQHGVQLIHFNGKYFRPLHGGSVRVLDKEFVDTFKTPLPDLRDWRICLSSKPPLGYDGVSVYVLDEYLSPTRRLLSVSEGSVAAARKKP